MRGLKYLENAAKDIGVKLGGKVRQQLYKDDFGVYKESSFLPAIGGMIEHFMFKNTFRFKDGIFVGTGRDGLHNLLLKNLGKNANPEDFFKYMGAKSLLSLRETDVKTFNKLLNTKSKVKAWEDVATKGDAKPNYVQSLNAMEQFNAAEKNRLAAMDEQNDIEAQKFNAQIELQVEQFNNNVENQRDIWNASNAQAIEQANTNWRRQANTANTAAINASNAQNVQNAYGISAQELDFIWNTLRDEATFLRKEALDTANQKTNLYITAMNNETNTAINSTGVADGVKNLIDGMFA